MRPRRTRSRSILGRASHLVLLACLLSWIGAALPARAERIGGLDAPESLRLQDRELVRNGIGIRRATRFFITADIYAAALYVAERTSDENQILDSREPKQILIRYLYAIDGDDMKRAWQYSFDKNCPNEDCSAYRQALQQFMEQVEAVKPGDRYVYRFFGDRSEIEHPSGEMYTIPGGAFSRLLLATWIGKVPPSRELKAALLARSEGEPK